jgi:hypothetical protein
MGTRAARVSTGGKFEQREKEVGLGFVRDLYTAREHTSPRSWARRRRQRRGESGHGVVLSTMRDEGMRTTLSLF